MNESNLIFKPKGCETQRVSLDPFNTPLGEIRQLGSTIEYHIYPQVQWVVKNYRKAKEKWYSQVADGQKWSIREYSLSERGIEQFKRAMEEQLVVKQ